MYIHRKIIYNILYYINISLSPSLPAGVLCPRSGTARGGDLGQWPQNWRWICQRGNHENRLGVDPVAWLNGHTASFDMCWLLSYILTWKGYRLIMALSDLWFLTSPPWISTTSSSCKLRRRIDSVKKAAEENPAKLVRPLPLCLILNWKLVWISGTLYLLLSLILLSLDAAGVTAMNRISRCTGPKHVWRLDKSHFPQMVIQTTNNIEGCWPIWPMWYPSVYPAATEAKLRDHRQAQACLGRAGRWSFLFR